MGKLNMKIKILIAGYEIAPFYKRGGLGDVMGSLPKALREINVDAKVVVPYYNEIRSKFEEQKIGEFCVHFGQKEEQVSVYEGFFSDNRVPIYFLSNKPNLSYINTHGRNKKIDQFAFFDLAVVHLIQYLTKNNKWKPNVVHCNDWQTALIPLILQKKVKLFIPTLLTIHNLAYQGWGSREVLNLLHIKDEDAKELKSGVLATTINLLGEGILYATKVSTVSEGYAKEITQDDGNDELIYKYLRRKGEESKTDGKVSGILNGIDYDVWNPKEDRFIQNRYSLEDWKGQKEKDKQSLLLELNLGNRPTFCFVGRMATQKGLDLIVKKAGKLSQMGINLIILGSGDPNIEKSVKKAAEKYSSWFKVSLDYSEEFAHRLYSGSDFILIPSHYEPCGLIQMVAMRYGTLPIAAKTGGLKDSIKNNINGLLFEKDSTRAFVKAVKKGLRIYLEKEKYNKMVERALTTDFSWKKSARKYKKLYLEMIQNS